MPAYVVAQMTMHDPEKYGRYVPTAVETIAAHGGRLLVAADSADVREGTIPAPRTVIIEFPSKEAAAGWYESEAYQAVLPLRLESSHGCLFIVDGFVMPSG